MRTLVTGVCFSSKNENTPHDFKNMCEWRQRSPSLFPLVVGWLFYSLLVAYFAPVWFFCSSRDNKTELCFGGRSPFPQRNLVGPVRFGFAFVAEYLLFSGSIEYSPFRWDKPKLNYDQALWVLYLYRRGSIVSDMNKCVLPTRERQDSRRQP